MAFAPFARFRNFTVENLKSLLEVYPDMAGKMLWDDAKEDIEIKLSGYKRTAYQQACQFGLENRSTEKFEVQKYLYTFDDEYLKKYVSFWTKTYYAPNPYVNSNDKAMLIYCEIGKEILSNEKHEIDFERFFNMRIAGGSSDILLNTLKNYANPIKYKKENNSHILYVEENNIELLKKEILFIEDKFPIINQDDKKVFFDRYSYENFCEFYGLSTEIDCVNILKDSTFKEKRKTGAENILLYGVPGAGKSHEIKTKYCSDEKYMERVVFHPDYMYSDFVGQILPRVEKDEVGNEKLKYVFTPGPFTKMLKKAENDPGNYYYLVIEELNRGNAPAIFGEIFQLLDRKDEDEFPTEEVGESEYGISNYDVAKEVYKDEAHPVRIPSNMYILATMNTADQNVFTMDTAFQRRWNMRQIENNFDNSEHSKDIIEGTKISWGAFATVINDMVIDMNADMASSEDKRLGTYFAKKKELQVNRFPEKVLKYLWDDAFKMEKTEVFNEACKSLEQVVITYERATADKLAAVLRLSVYNKMLSKMQTINEENEIN